jgi:hypothetical protein
MKRLALITLLALSLSPAAASSAEKKPKSEKKRPEVGASCNAPAVGTCAACSITCRPGESATCGGAVVFNDICHTQPTCRCAR